MGVVQCRGSRMEWNEAIVVQINASQGLRDREYAKEKPANTLRIANLGDSFAQAFQALLEKTFWFVLEGKLLAFSRQRFDCPRARLCMCHQSAGRVRQLVR